MNLPNKITITRILLVPIMMIIPYINIETTILYGLPISNIIILITFLVASLTDFLDGYIARKKNIVTNFGKFLDPIADKILVIAAMAMLVEMAKLPAWIPIIVITREFIVSGYRLVAVEKGGKVIAASIWGKLKTVTQMFAIILAFIDINGFGAFLTMELTGTALGINILATGLMFISVIATIFSGWDYVKNGKELFKD